MFPAEAGGPPFVRSRPIRGYRRVILEPGTLKAVIFDVDFTIARPGPDLGPDGYRRLGERYGLTLDPERYEEARRAAFGTLNTSRSAAAVR